MTTFKFLKSRPFTILDFKKFKCRTFQMPTGFTVGICVVVQHFTMIAKTVAEIWFDLIFNMAAVRHLGFLSVLGITHEEYLAIFTVMQNLVVMGNVVFSERELSLYAVARPSVVCLSVACNARAPYSDGWNFRQYFYGIWYPGHFLTFTENFTKIVPGEPLRRGVKHNRGSKI